jgi:hypothetical protein
MKTETDRKIRKFRKDLGQSSFRPLPLPGPPDLPVPLLFGRYSEWN